MPRGHERERAGVPAMTAYTKPVPTGGAVALPPPAAGRQQRFDAGALFVSIAGGIVLGGAFRGLRVLAPHLPGTFWSAAGAGVIIGVLLMMASKPSPGAGGGPNGPNWRALLMAAG